MARPASNFDDNRIQVRRQWCKGCGICTALCANRVLLIDNRGKAVVANPSACTGCGKCENHCPDFAISVERNGGKDKLSLFTPENAGLKRTPGQGDIARV